ncbi:MAG: chemotaxis protein CheW [Candidatus Competibacter sp.]
MSDEQAQLSEILERRRQANSGILDVEAPTAQMVIFALGNELFAFPGANITEILPLSPIYFVPGCPPSLEGVINVRGDIASVIRLSDLLGVERAAIGRRTAILMGQGGGMRSGLRVDRVEDVLDVVRDTIHDPPCTLPEELRPLATGVFEHRGRMVLALDLERLFQDYRAGLG